MAASTRAATAADCARIAEIYNQGIEDRIATFETALRTTADIESWLDDTNPLLVCERDGEVAAFARLTSYRDRPCYAGVREFSVYVARDARGCNLGMTIMKALIDAAPGFGVHKLIARIFTGNAASLALCDRLGFRRVGVYHKHGQLDGRWRDCVIVELCLNAGA